MTVSNFGGVDKPRFSFYKSRRNHGDRSRMNLELVSFFLFFFLFSTDGQALEQLDWKYVTILEEGMKLYAIALQVIT